MNPPRTTLYLGDCRSILPDIPDASVDAVLCDPPYPEIDRSYGRMSERDWMTFMRAITIQSRRILRPSGSAVFVLQPNSRTPSSMRLWPWRFLLWAAASWNLVQDFYWWNVSAPPTIHSQRRYGLLRPSVKLLVWLGPPDCYRNQNAVLWTVSAATRAASLQHRALRTPHLHYSPSGHHVRESRIIATALDRDGSTPFNLIPFANSDSVHSAGTADHGAGTPYRLAAWLVSYLTPPHGTVLDMCMGSGSIGVAALHHHRSFIGIERDPEFFAVAQRRLADAVGPLFQSQSEESPPPTNQPDPV